MSYNLRKRRGYHANKDEASYEDHSAPLSESESCDPRTFQPKAREPQPLIRPAPPPVQPNSLKRKFSEANLRGEEPLEVTLIPPPLETVKALEKLVILEEDDASQRGDPIPPQFKIELDEIIPKLRKRAVALDQEQSFTTKFSGHLAQLNRDLSMYLFGMKGSVPKKWEWAIQEIMAERLEAERQQNQSYQHFLTLAHQFGYTVSQGQDRLVQPPPIKGVVYRGESVNYNLIDSLQTKYRINEQGQPIISATTTPLPPQAKKKVAPVSTSLVTNNDHQKQLVNYFNSNSKNGSTGTALKERPNSNSDSDSDEAPPKPFLVPYNTAPKKPRLAE